MEPVECVTPSIVSACKHTQTPPPQKKKKKQRERLAEGSNAGSIQPDGAPANAVLTTEPHERQHILYKRPGQGFNKLMRLHWLCTLQPASLNRHGSI